jgi:uncharacterized protein
VAALVMVLPTVQDVVVLLTIGCLLPELVVLLKTLKFVRWREAGAVLLFTAMGVPLGTAALEWIDPPLALTMLGIFLVAVGLVFLFLPARGQGISWPVWAGPLAGLVGGMLGGMFGTGGPPIIIYFHLSRLHKSTFRGQLMVVLGTITLVRLPSYALAGLFTTARLWSGLLVIPWVVVGAYAGYRLHLELKEETFRKVVSVLLAAMGVMLLLR